MKAIKYVFDSVVFESLVLTSAKDDIIYMMMEYFNLGPIMHSYSFNQGRREWILQPLDCSELSVKDALKLRDELLDLNRVVGVNDVQEYFLTALSDLEDVIRGNKPSTHRKPGIVIDYQEFNH